MKTQKNGKEQIMKNSKFVWFLLGVVVFLLMGAFTRDWTESTPTDNTVANQIDDYNRYLRVDASDRLKEMIYGFTAGENSGNPGFKELIFKQQSGAAGTTNADEITWYSIDDGSNCGLYVIQEDGYTKQILKKVGSDINFVIETADIPADVIDSVHYAALSIDAEHLAADVIDETIIADDGIDSEHYNDGSIDAVHIANIDPDSYAAEESVTFANGLIIKMDTDSVATGATISFDSAFPNAIVSVVPALTVTSTTLSVNVENITTGGFDVFHNSGGSTIVQWIAIGY